MPRIFTYTDLPYWAGTERIILEDAAHDDYSALISTLVHKRSDGKFYCAGPLIVTGGNANSLAVDNTGQQYTEIDFKNNGTLKAAAYWENSTPEFVVRTLVSGAGIGFDVNAVRQMTVGASNVDYVGGVRIANNKYIWGKRTGGSYTRILGLDTADGMMIGSMDAALDTTLSYGGGNVWSGGPIYPNVDNTRNLGHASYRWAAGYIAVAWTVGSDARMKTVRDDGGPTDAERAWARSIRTVCYQLNDSIAEKGEAARLHWGVLAQEVHQAGLDAGIEDPFRYGFLGCDALVERIEKPVTVTRPKMETVTIIERVVESRDGKAVVVEQPVEREQPVMEEQPLFDEAGAPLMIERPKTETRTTKVIEVQDGKAAVVSRDVEAPVTEAVPLFDGAKKVMIEVDDPDAPGTLIRVQATIEAPVMERVQATHLVPVMETAEEMQTVEVPLMKDGEQVTRWNVRYTELVMFMLACGAFERGAA